MFPSLPPPEWVVPIVSFVETDNVQHVVSTVLVAETAAVSID